MTLRRLFKVSFRFVSSSFDEEEEEVTKGIVLWWQRLYAFFSCGDDRLVLLWPIHTRPSLELTISPQSWSRLTNDTTSNTTTTNNKNNDLNIRWNSLTNIEVVPDNNNYDNNLRFLRQRDLTSVKSSDEDTTAPTLNPQKCARKPKPNADYSVHFGQLFERKTNNGMENAVTAAATI